LAEDTFDERNLGRKKLLTKESFDEPTKNRILKSADYPKSAVVSLRV